MKILLATSDDVETLVEVYEQARLKMNEFGNPNQWVNGYPSREVILNDIMSESLYLCLEGEKILGCLACIEGDDPTYESINDGCWINDEPYVAIHRLAVVEHGKGVGRYCIDWSINQYRNIKVDTHADNIPMQKLLSSAGFQRCGVIRNRWGDERVAYQGAFNK